MPDAVALRRRDPDRCGLLEPRAVPARPADRGGHLGGVTYDRGVAAGELLQRGGSAAVVLGERGPEAACRRVAAGMQKRHRMTVSVLGGVRPVADDGEPCAERVGCASPRLCPPTAPITPGRDQSACAPASGHHPCEIQRLAFVANAPRYCILSNCGQYHHRARRSFRFHPGSPRPCTVSSRPGSRRWGAMQAAPTARNHE